jgi:hypothetical protein
MAEQINKAEALIKNIYVALRTDLGKDGPVGAFSEIRHALDLSIDRLQFREANHRPLFLLILAPVHIKNHSMHFFLQRDTKYTSKTIRRRR